MPDPNTNLISVVNPDGSIDELPQTDAIRRVKNRDAVFAPNQTLHLRSLSTGSSVVIDVDNTPNIQAIVGRFGVPTSDDPNSQDVNTLDFTTESHPQLDHDGNNIGVRTVRVPAPLAFGPAFAPRPIEVHSVDTAISPSNSAESSPEQEQEAPSHPDLDHSGPNALPIVDPSTVSSFAEDVANKEINSNLNDDEFLDRLIQITGVQGMIPVTIDGVRALRSKGYFLGHPDQLNNLRSSISSSSSDSPVRLVPSDIVDQIRNIRSAEDPLATSQTQNALEALRSIDRHTLRSNRSIREWVHSPSVQQLIAQNQSATGSTKYIYYINDGATFKVPVDVTKRNVGSFLTALRRIAADPDSSGLTLNTASNINNMRQQRAGIVEARGLIHSAFENARVDSSDLDNISPIAISRLLRSSEVTSLFEHSATATGDPTTFSVFNTEDQTVHTLRIPVPNQIDTLTDEEHRKLLEVLSSLGEENNTTWRPITTMQGMSIRRDTDAVQQHRAAEQQAAAGSMEAWRLSYAQSDEGQHFVSGGKVYRLRPNAAEVLVAQAINAFTFGIVFRAVIADQGDLGSFDQAFEDHPYASMAGQLIGMAPFMFGTGTAVGLGRIAVAAEDASRFSRLLRFVGVSTESLLTHGTNLGRTAQIAVTRGMLTEGIASTIARGASSRLLTRAGASSLLARGVVAGAGSVARGATEGGVFGIYQTLIDESQSRPDGRGGQRNFAFGEHLAHNVAINAAAGGILSPVFHLVGAGGVGLYRRIGSQATEEGLHGLAANQSVRSVTTAIDQFESSLSGQRLSVHQREALAIALTRTTRGAALVDAFAQGDNWFESTAFNISQRLDNLQATVSAANEAGTGLIKASNMRNLIAEHFSTATPANNLSRLNESLKFADSHMQEVRSLIDEITGSPGVVGGRRAVKPLQQELARLENRVTTIRASISAPGGAANDNAVNALSNSDLATAASDLFMDLDRVKRGLGSLTQSSARGGNLGVLNNQLEDIYGGLQQHLQDTQVFGQAAAAQTEINSAWSSLIAASRPFGRLFTSNSGENAGFRVLSQVDPKKIKQLLTVLGTTDGSVSHSIFQKYVHALDEFASSLRTHYDIPEALVSDIKNARGIAFFMRDQGLGEVSRGLETGVIASNRASLPASSTEALVRRSVTASSERIEAVLADVRKLANGGTVTNTQVKTAVAEAALRGGVDERVAAQIIDKAARTNSSVANLAAEFNTSEDAIIHVLQAVDATSMTPFEQAVRVNTLHGLAGRLASVSEQGSTESIIGALKKHQYGLLLGTLSDAATILKKVAPGIGAIVPREVRGIGEALVNVYRRQFPKGIGSGDLATVLEQIHGRAAPETVARVATQRGAFEAAVETINNNAATVRGLRSSLRHLEEELEASRGMIAEQIKHADAITAGDIAAASTELDTTRRVAALEEATAEHMAQLDLSLGTAAAAGEQLRSGLADAVRASTKHADIEAMMETVLHSETGIVDEFSRLNITEFLHVHTAAREALTPAAKELREIAQRRLLVSPNVTRIGGNGYKEILDRAQERFLRNLDELVATNRVTLSRDTDVGISLAAVEEEFIVGIHQAIVDASNSVHATTNELTPQVQELVTKYTEALDSSSAIFSEIDPAIREEITTRLAAQAGGDATAQAEVKRLLEDDPGALFNNDIAQSADPVWTAHNPSRFTSRAAQAVRQQAEEAAEASAAAVRELEARIINLEEGMEGVRGAGQRYIESNATKVRTANEQLTNYLESSADNVQPEYLARSIGSGNNTVAERALASSRAHAKKIVKREIATYVDLRTQSLAHRWSAAAARTTGVLNKDQRTEVKDALGRTMSTLGDVASELMRGLWDNMYFRFMIPGSANEPTVPVEGGISAGYLIDEYPDIRGNAREASQARLASFFRDYELVNEPQAIFTHIFDGSVNSHDMKTLYRTQPAYLGFVMQLMKDSLSAATVNTDITLVDTMNYVANFDLESVAVPVTPSTPATPATPAPELALNTTPARPVTGAQSRAIRDIPTSASEVTRIQNGNS